jgi:hypothetical protein
MAGLQEPAALEGGTTVIAPTALAQNQEKTDPRTESEDRDGAR